jgi:DNA-binding MarR family transcriptional regulator
MSRSDDDLAREWHALMGRYHRTSCVLDRELEQAHGISGSDFEVLQQLAVNGEDGSLRMHELADHVHLTQSALSRLVSRLERDGLVDRAMCVDDRRSVSTRITAAGRERFEQARATQRSVLRDAAAEAAASSAPTRRRSVSAG